MSNNDIIKDRISRDFGGRHAALGIGGPDLWLRKNRFGAVGLNRGGTLEQRPTQQQAFDGWYAFGTYHAALHFVGSTNAYGPYVDRGPFFVDDGFATYQSNTLRVWQKGFGAAVTTQTFGTATDFNGKTYHRDLVQIFTTYNGKKFSLAYGVLWDNPYIGESDIGVQNQSFSTARSTVILSPKVDWMPMPTGFMQYRGGQYKFSVGLSDSGGAYFGNPNTMDYQLAYEFFVFQTSPRGMVGYGTYVRPRYDQHPELISGPPLAHPIDIAACPGLVFQFSDDRGFTWTDASSTDLFDDFFDTVQTLPATPLGWSTIFNEAVDAASFQCAAISNRYAVALAGVPYVTFELDGVTFKDIQMKVKLGLVDHASRTIFETAVLFDGDLDDAQYFIGTIFSVAGGAVFTTHPGSAPDQRDNPMVFHFTPDGIGYTTGPNAPYPFGPIPAWQCGIPKAIGPNKIQCPFYDGANSLYESRDRGATWERKGFLFKDAPAPIKVPGAGQLIDFAAVTHLRTAGAAVTSNEGAPWSVDERYDPPIL